MKYIIIGAIPEGMASWRTSLIFFMQLARDSGRIAVLPCADNGRIVDRPCWAGGSGHMNQYFTYDGLKLYGAEWIEFDDFVKRMDLQDEAQRPKSFARLPDPSRKYPVQSEKQFPYPTNHTVDIHLLFKCIKWFGLITLRRVCFRLVNNDDVWYFPFINRTTLRPVLNEFQNFDIIPKDFKTRNFDDLEFINPSIVALADKFLEEHIGMNQSFNAYQWRAETMSANLLDCMDNFTTMLGNHPDHPLWKTNVLISDLPGNPNSSLSIPILDDPKNHRAIVAQKLLSEYPLIKLDQFSALHDDKGVLALIDRIIASRATEFFTCAKYNAPCTKCARHPSRFAWRILADRHKLNVPSYITWDWERAKFK